MELAHMLRKRNLKHRLFLMSVTLPQSFAQLGSLEYIATKGIIDPTEAFCMKVCFIVGNIMSYLHSVKVGQRYPMVLYYIYTIFSLLKAIKFSSKLALSYLQLRFL